MSLEEAQAYLTSRESEEDRSLRAFSDEALGTALRALKAAVKEKTRATQFGSVEDGFTRATVIDVEAAKALLKAGIDAKKLLRLGSLERLPGGVEIEDGKDLFDSPWSFRRSD